MDAWQCAAFTYATQERTQGMVWGIALGVAVSLLVCGIALALSLRWLQQVKAGAR